MRLNTAGAVFVAFAMVAAAIGIVASNALVPGFLRLTSELGQPAALGSITARLPLLRSD